MCTTAWCPVCQVVGFVRDNPEVVSSVKQSAAQLAQSMAWHSLAGLAFRQRAEIVCRDLIGLSSTMDTLADAVRQRAAVLAALP